MNEVDKATGTKLPSRPWVLGMRTEEVRRLVLRNDFLVILLRLVYSTICCGNIDVI